MKRTSFPPLRRQRGLALIMAVLIAALATSAVAFAAWRQQVRLRDANLRRDSVQVQQLARATVSIAKVLLIKEQNDDYQTGGPFDHFGEAWVQPRQYDVEQGKASGRLVDMQGRFNLNALLLSNSPNVPVQPDLLGVYVRLLTHLQVPQPQRLAATLADWLDNDGAAVTAPDGAEDAVYLEKSPPYRAANNYLSDLSDLLKVEGYTPELVKKLQAHVVALPQPQQAPSYLHVNINTTTPEVLAAFLPGLPLADARQIVEDLKRQPVRNLQALSSRYPSVNKVLTPSQTPGPVANPSQYLNGSSYYFLLELNVRFGQVDWRENVLMYREAGLNVAQVLWRKRVAD